jgi:hypothetical protein
MVALLGEIIGIPLWGRGASPAYKIEEAEES